LGESVDIEWAVAAKIIRFVSELPPKEQWQLGLALPTVALAIGTLIWNRGKVSGRTFEVLHGQVPALKLHLDSCRHENGKLSDQLDRRVEQVRILEQTADVAKRGAVDLPEDLKEVLRIREELIQADAEIWGLRKARPLPHLRERLLASGLTIITVGNLKGGVGKTTITSNLAAFFDKKLGKRVLVIDLDYQGSLTAAMLQAAGKQIDTSLTDHLIGGTATGRWVLDVAKDLSPALAHTHIIPAGYTLASTEDQMMLRWLFHTSEADVRFNLAEALLSEEVRKAYQIILLDVGPRLTTASISALCASTHFIVPTNLDKLSAETIGSFLNRVRALKEDLGLPLELAGIVGTMSYRYHLSDEEEDAMGTIRDGLKRWGPDGHIFKRTVPRKKILADVAGSDIGYLMGFKGRAVRDIFDTLGHEVAARINL
jgi:chromosome partitioning protein